MKLSTILLTGILALGAISIASAKSYDIVLSSPSKAGNLQLKAGEYRLTISGNKVVFTDVETTKSYTTDVKVENTTAKFDDTRVDSAQEGGAAVIKDIQLGGSKTQIDF